MADVPFYNIDAGETVEMKFLSGVRERENKDKGYMMYFYDVQVEGDRYSFNASPGLQKLFEEDGVGEGALVVINRKGTGLDTRWRVTTKTPGKGASKVAEASRATPRGPAPSQGISLDDMKAAFTAMLDMVKTVNDSREGEAITTDGLYASAAALAHAALDHGLKLATQKTPAEFVLDLFKRAGIKATEWEALSLHLFGHGLEDVNRDDAKMLWNLTEGGKNIEPLVDQHRRMSEPEDDDVDIDESDLPF